MKNKLTHLLIAFAFCAPAWAQTTVLIGGTVVDVSDFGRSTQDIEEAYVVVADGMIIDVGTADGFVPPADAEIIDATGMFIVPGLIDGFATLNDQSYANAYLYEGVTSIIGVSGGRRGDLFRSASPTPRIYELESVGDESATTDELMEDLEALHGQGIRIALLMYRIEPEQLPILVQRARELGMGTIGELAAATYAQGDAAGVDAFVHTTRYCLDLASDEMRQGVLAEPFSDDLASSKWRYYLWLSGLNGTEPVVTDLAEQFASGDAALMPTLALLYLDHPFSRNPWDETIASILSPGFIDNPANRMTGKHIFDQAHLDAYARVAGVELKLDAAFKAAGARYLAGSATDVWGTMPGISLHSELELLVRIGLTPREALAAATSNIASTFRWSDVGEVRASARADILILSNDPREDVAHLKDIVHVMQDGVLIDREALLHIAPCTDAPDGTLLAREPFEPNDSCYDEGGELLARFDYLADVSVESITYASDGLRVKGYLVQPNEPGNYPTIIYNRGGNRGFGAVSHWKITHLLARVSSWGYIVVASQYRGVAGGDGMEQFGGDEVSDVLNLIPLLDDLPNADASRMGIMGGSRGGMMTYLALAKTDRFSAAVVRCGVSDLTDWGSERPEMMEVFNDLILEFDPNDPMCLESRSAVHWADRLDKTAPILVCQGTADWRVSPRSATQFAEALLEAQHPFRLVMFEGGDHSLSEHIDEFYTLTQQWFDRYVRDQEALPNMEPHGG